jgi:hypothetical protein
VSESTTGADILVLVTTLVNPAVRTARRGLVVAAVTGLGVAATVAPAHADVPEGWSDPAEVDALQALLLLAGVPILLFVVITLAVYLPALARGEKVRPGASPVEDQWFGGPRPGSRELPSGAEARETGGARGSW